jgi:hypothetical protein
VIALGDNYVLRRGTSGQGRLSFEAARALLRRIADVATLRHALATFGEPGVHRLDDAAVIDALARMTAWGSLAIERVAATAIDIVPRGKPAEELESEAAEEEVAEEEEAPQKKRSWITVALAREDDVPLANQRYRIQLPDGSVREGTLDAAGQVHLEDIDPGQCTVTFPGL